MKRKLEIIAVIILLCNASCFVYYEYKKPQCTHNTETKIIYYTMPNDNGQLSSDDISDTIRDEAIQHEQR